MNQHRYIQPAGTISGLAHSEDSDKRETAHELAQAIGESYDVLARAETVFPLTLFPDTITIDRSKITITQRSFMKSGEVLSIRIEDVLNVTAKVGPFFGSLLIATRFFNPEKPYMIDHFWRADVLRIKRVLQGYLIARQHNIDCSKLSTEELSHTLDELGNVSREDRV